MKLLKFNIKHMNNSIEKMQCFFLFISILLMADYALGDDVFTTKFCNLTGVIKGPVGMGICMLSLIGLFLSVLFGKIDFRTFFLTVFAILSIFYAQEVISFITQNDAYKNCTQPVAQPVAPPA